MAVVAFTSSAQASAWLQRLPAVVRAHNAAGETVARHGPNVPNMSPRAVTIYRSLQAAVAEEEAALQRLRRDVVDAAERAAEQGMITPADLANVRGDGLGAILALAITAVVGLAIVAVAGLFAVSLWASSVQARIDHREAVLRQFMSLSPEDRGEVIRLFNTPGFDGDGGGGAIVPAAVGGISFGMIVIGGVLLLMLMKGRR